MQQRKRVVIVGGGFAGLGVARGLSRAPVDITIVDRSNHHVFQPLLYQVAMGGLAPAEIASPIRNVLRKQKNVTCWMAEVSAIDTEKQCLELDNGKQHLPYDILVLAAGGRTSYFGHDEWEAVAPGLKSISDALEIRQRVLLALEKAERCEDEKEREQLMTMVVIGGGPTGVEMAGGLAELTRSVLPWDFRRIKPSQARIILLEGGPRLLAAMDEDLSAYTARRLQKMGVEVLVNERVQEIRERHVRTDKREIDAHTIIWAAGVGGNPLARMIDASKDRAGRVIVDADLRVSGLPNVYCLGDMASYVHPHTFNGKPLPGVAPVAMQQGHWAAKNIRAQLKGETLKPFQYLDKGTMATIGRTSAVAHSGPLKFTGLLAWFAWLFIHVLYLVDFQNQVMVMMRWMWAYFTWKWNARLITQIPELPVSRTLDQKPDEPTPEVPAPNYASNQPVVESGAAPKSDS